MVFSLADDDTRRRRRRRRRRRGGGRSRSRRGPDAGRFPAARRLADAGEPGVRAIPARGSRRAASHLGPSSHGGGGTGSGGEGTGSGGEGTGSGGESLLGTGSGRGLGFGAFAQGKERGSDDDPGGRPAAAAIKWGAAKGKVVAPRTPGVADVAARVVAEMARSGVRRRTNSSSTIDSF